jgi:hypothetical protein
MPAALALRCLAESSAPRCDSSKGFVLCTPRPMPGPPQPFLLACILSPMRGRGGGEIGRGRRDLVLHPRRACAPRISCLQRDKGVSFGRQDRAAASRSMLLRPCPLPPAAPAPPPSSQGLGAYCDCSEYAGASAERHVSQVAAKGLPALLSTPAPSVPQSIVLAYLCWQGGRGGRARTPWPNIPSIV